MKILFINGNPDENNKIFESSIENLSKALTERGDSVKTIILREKKIIHCTGCWGCWVKNPGECSFKDDSLEIRKSYINSDFVVFASPLILGFVSSLTKIIMDKCIPLLHPYIKIVKKETHHSKRYNNYPLIGLLYEDPENDPEDVEITTNIFKRFALNFRTELAFSSSIDKQIPEVLNEIIAN